MRILLLTHYYAPESGPPQLRWGSLIREFTAAGHEVVVIAPHPHYPIGATFDDYVPTASWKKPERGAHGEQIYRVKYMAHHGAVRSVLGNHLVVASRMVVSLLRLRRDLAPDVIVATSPALPTMFVGLVARAALRAPVVLELRDAWPDLVDVADRWDADGAPLRLRKKVALWIAPRAMTWAQRRADHLVVTTSAFAAVLRQRGMPAVTVVRNAAHDVPNAPHPEDRTPSHRLNVIYVGTVGRAQGMDTALDAVAIARDRGVDVRLRIIGAGVDLDRITRLATMRHLPVSVIGSVERHELAEHYAWADTSLVLLRPWIPLEWTVPSKLYEAMSIGIHVSAAARGETARIVAESGCGFAVAPGDSHALAQRWVEMSTRGFAPIDVERSRQWLADHANTQLGARTYLDVMATPGRPHRVIEPPAAPTPPAT